MRVEPTDGTITWKPDLHQPGTHVVSVTVDDLQGIYGLGDKKRADLGPMVIEEIGRYEEGTEARRHEGPK